MTTYYNTAPYPLCLADGSQLEPGQTIELSGRYDPHDRDLIDQNHLMKVPEAEKEETKSASSGGSDKGKGD